MKDRVIIDTNILVYLAADTTEKRDVVVTKLAECEYSFISTQVLSEFNNSCFRKSILNPSEIEFAVTKYSEMFNVAILNVKTIIRALEVKQKYAYSYYDSLIIATALQNDCVILYSEDMHHLQKIEEKMTIINPFK